MTLIGCRCNYSNVFSRAVLIARALFFSPDLYVLCDIKAQIYTFSIYSITVSVIVVNDWNVITLKELFFVQGLWLSNIKAIDSVGDPPLPIPNREVKPNSADGTAFSCGRVGHRHFFSEELWLILRLFFFVYIILWVYSPTQKSLLQALFDCQRWGTHPSHEKLSNLFTIGAPMVLHLVVGEWNNSTFFRESFGYKLRLSFFLYMLFDW